MTFFFTAALRLCLLFETNLNSWETQFAFTLRSRKLFGVFKQRNGTKRTED